jgi:hypothetical protein
MLSLDLFNTKYERELREGAVDNLEARRIDDLNMRMLELLDRAKEPAYKKNPAALAGLKKQFQKIKSERDSYFKINPATGMNDAGTLGTVKGALDEVDPAQKLPAKGQDLISPQQRVAGATPAKPGVAGAVKDVAGGLKRWLQGKPDQGPTYEGQEGSSPRALGAANFQRLVKANMGNIPTVNFEFIRPEENFKLDQRGLDLISDYYDGLANDQAKNYFIYRVLPSGDETLTVLKQLGWTPARPVQQELPGMPTQGELPLQEKKKSDDNLKAGDVKVARELQKLRARYPAVRSDIEAVASAEIDSTERSQQQLAAIRGANEKQDALLKQLVSLDQEQGREINGLDQENNSLEQRLAQVQATNDRLQQAVGQMTGTKKVAAKTQKTASHGSRDIAQGGIIDVDAAITSTPDTTSATNTKPTTSPAMASMAQQIQGLAKAAPSIRPAPGVKAANEPIQQQPKVVGSDITEHGGGIGPRQHWQDLMPEQSNPEDDDWYDDEEDQETELRSGDYVRDTMDGESGEVFRMQGDPYERRVRILDRDGKGWYIEPGRLTRVDPTDPDVQRYFGKKRVRDMDEAKWDPWTGGDFSDTHDMNHLPSDDADADPNKTTAEQFKAMIQYHSNNALVRQALDDLYRVTVGGGYDDSVVRPERYLATVENQRTGKTEKRYFKSKEDAYRYAKGNNAVITNLEKIDTREDTSDLITLPVILGLGDHKKKWMLKFPSEDYAQKWEFKHKNAAQIQWPAGHALAEDAQDSKSWMTQTRAKYPTAKFMQAKMPGAPIRAYVNGKVVAEFNFDKEQGVAEAVDEKGALKSAQAAAKFIIRNLDDRAALKDYSLHFWSPEKFYQGATMAMRGVDADEIVKHIIQDRPVKFESDVAEGWSDRALAQRTGQPRTPYAVYIKGKKWKDFENEDLARAVMDRLKAKFKADGRDPETITIAPADMTEGLKSTLAGAALAGAMALGGAGAAQAQSAAGGSSMANATTIIQQIQAGKIQNQNDLSAALGDNQSIRQFVFKQLQAKAGLPGHGADSVINALAKKSTAGAQQPGAQQPGAQQPVKSVGQSGSIVQRPTDNFESRIKEEQDSSGVERAILNRIMVAHTDLLMKFGPDKVMQAAEEVAYNVGDVDEIGTSDVSAYVAQVKQILGAAA